MDKKILLASDHAGFELKNKLLNYLNQKGWITEDKGCFSTNSVDYPDFAHSLATDIDHKKAFWGVLVCGSGQGVSITANRHSGVRAALCWSPEVVKLARNHNNANVLCLPARFINEDIAIEMLEVFLQSPFEGGRHADRVAKINC